MQGDAARGAIGADRARIIDRRDSVVTAEPDEERLLLRAMATSRKCVLARAVSTTLASWRRRPVLTFDTVNLEARATPPGVVVETL